MQIDPQRLECESPLIQLFTTPRTASAVCHTEGKYDLYGWDNIKRKEYRVKNTTFKQTPELNYEHKEEFLE